MKDLFASLISRHLGTCDTVQPRTLGRFEVDRGAGALTETLVSPDEDINPAPSGIGVPKVAIQESDLNGPGKDYSSLSNLVLNNSSARLGVTEQQATLSDSHTLPGRSYENHPFDETVRNTLPPNPRVAEHDLDSNFKQRIHVILQHLQDDSITPVTEPVLIDQGREQNEGQMMLNNVLDDDKVENSVLYDSLQPHSWLPEIEARLNTHLKNKEAKTEPVINVTIGRVEVRAVQTEAPTKVQRSKKPKGVMPLDEYLKKRKDRGSV